MIPELTAQQQAAALVLGGITTLSISANAIIGVAQKIASMRAMRNPKRTPPLGEEAAKLYATKTDMAALRSDWRAECSGRHAPIEGTLKEIFNTLREAAIKQADWQSSVAQQLGRIDGTMEMIKERLP